MPCNILVHNTISLDFFCTHGVASLRTNNVPAQVIIKQQDEAEAAYQKHKAQHAKVKAWGLQVAALKHDMKEGIKHVGRLVKTGQTPETSAEMLRGHHKCAQHAGRQVQRGEDMKHALA